MLSFYEVFDRFLEGPHVTEMDFDLGIFHILTEMINKYGIKFDPENPIPNDDRMADDLFQAGLEFFEKTGVYCVDSQRVVKFTRQEILESLNETPSEPVFGEGKDAKKLIARPPDSNHVPWCFIGAAGSTATDERILSAMVESFGLNPLGNSITTPNLQKVDGRSIIAGTPLEILGCIRTVKVSRDALKKAGRPGMPLMNSISTAVTDTAKIAGSQFDLRPSDGTMIGSMSEFKFNYQRMNEIAFVLQRKGHIVAESSPLLGGYCGGAEGVAISNVAYHVQSILVQRGSCQVSFPLDFKWACNSTRQVIWATSISNQAISRNSKLPFFTVGILASGPGTEMSFHENAARTIATCVSGGHIEAIGLAKNGKIDYNTPWDSRFSTEIAHAAAGMKRDRANEIIKDLLNKYELKIPQAPEGRRYQDLFNLDSLEPNNEYLELFEKMKDEIRLYDLKLNA
jgi:hypothetical protein